MTKTRRRFGAVRKLASGRWQARYPDAEGVLRPAPQTFDTKTEAARYLAVVEANQVSGRWQAAPAPAVSVAEWGRRHLAAQRHRLAPKTYALYVGLLEGLLVPDLGELPLSAVKKITVREWVAGLSAARLSPARVRHALGLLSQILGAAVQDDLIATNPCAGVRPPRLPTTEPKILTPAQVADLHAAIRPPFGLLVDLLAYGGLRIGEAFALRRRSLDEVHRRLLVAESLSETAGRLSFGPTKTHQVRAISLPDFLFEQLRTHLSTTVADSADALLFVGRTGQPLHYNAFRRWTWDPAVEAAGLDGVTPHALRASCATWVADSAGVLEAARRLGHARTSVTTRHYARPIEGRDRDVANQLESLRANGSRDVGPPPIWHANGTRDPGADGKASR